MLKIINCFFCLLLVLFQTYGGYARNKWARVGPTTYIAVARQSPTTIVVLGNGQIQTTSDLGYTWKTNVIDDTLRFTGIAFADSLHGVIAEDRRYILRTSDGGETWLYHDLGEFCFPRSIAYLSKDSIFLTDIYGTIWRSTNAGDSWDKQRLGPMQLQLYASSTYFLDSRNGFVVGDSGFKVRTTDGGNTWSSFTLEDTITTRPLNSIHFFDSKFGVIASYNFFYVTSDGGATWISRPIPSGMNQAVFNAIMVSPTQFMGFGPTGSVYESDDFGATILDSKIPDSDFRGYFTDAVWLPGIGGIAVGERGTICSDSVGQSWRTITSCWITEGALADIQPGKLLAVSAAIGSSVFSSQSTDGGRLWRSATVPGMNYAGLHFYAPDSAILIPQFNLGQSLETTDGGNSWHAAGIVEPPPYTRRWASYQISFSADGTGYTGAGDGILRSTDHGRTWQYSNFSPPGGLSSPFSAYAMGGWYLVNFFSVDRKIAFALVTVVDTQLGNPYATRYRSLLVRTSDAGEKWELANAPRTTWIKSLFFTDQDHGFLGCADGILFRTTNGGISWDSIKLATSEPLTAIALKGSLGVIGTLNVELFLSSDSGVSWLQDGPTLRNDGLGSFRIMQIIFPDSNSIVAIGARDFFRRDIAELPLTVEGGKQVQGNQYMFISIYPNPTHSEFTCKLHGTYSANGGKLSAEILDLLGRTVMNLTQQANNANNGQIAEFTVDASGLIAGVYFLKYTLGSNSYTRRFIKYP